MSGVLLVYLGLGKGLKLLIGTIVFLYLFFPKTKK